MKHKLKQFHTSQEITFTLFPNLDREIDLNYGLTKQLAPGQRRKLNVHKTFRRRLRRIMHVLCTHYPPHFVLDFSRKIFLMLYSTDRISLSDCLYFLRH